MLMWRTNRFSSRVRAVTRDVSVYAAFLVENAFHKDERKFLRWVIQHLVGPQWDLWRLRTSEWSKIELPGGLQRNFYKHFENGGCQEFSKQSKQTSNQTSKKNETVREVKHSASPVLDLVVYPCNLNKLPQDSLQGCMYCKEYRADKRTRCYDCKNVNIPRFASIVYANISSLKTRNVYLAFDRDW